MELNKESILRDSIKSLKSNNELSIREQRILGFVIAEHKNYIEEAGFKIQQSNIKLFKGFFISDKKSLIEILELLMWYSK